MLLRCAANKKECEIIHLGKVQFVIWSYCFLNTAKWLVTKIGRETWRTNQNFMCQHNLSGCSFLCALELIKRFYAHSGFRRRAWTISRLQRIYSVRHRNGKGPSKCFTDKKLGILGHCFSFEDERVYSYQFGQRFPECWVQCCLAIESKCVWLFVPILADIRDDFKLFRWDVYRNQK